MTSQGSSGPHLDPSNGVDSVDSGLGQVGITRRFPPLPDGVLEVLGLLPQCL